jgi:hypothetical protein
MAFLIPSIQFSLGLPRALFSFGINCNADATIYSLLYFCKLLYMFRVVTPPIIRSTYNCNYSIWYCSNRLCYLPLSWRSCTLHPSSGAHITVITASGTVQTISATFRYREAVAHSTHHQEHI